MNFQAKNVVLGGYYFYGWQQHFDFNIGSGEPKPSDSCDNIPIDLCNRSNHTPRRTNQGIQAQEDRVQCGDEEINQQHFKCEESGRNIKYNTKFRNTKLNEKRFKGNNRHRFRP